MLSPYRWRLGPCIIMRAITLVCRPVSRFSPSSEPITLVISESVAPEKMDEYEIWATGINQAVRRAEGFIGVEVLRPRDNAYSDYVVIVRFDSYDHLRRWVTSPLYKQWIEKSQDLIARRSLRHMTTGMDIWFGDPVNVSNPSPASPPYYKKVILGVLAVYPLIVLSNYLIRPFLEPLPPPLALLISVVFVSALLTYPVMPAITYVLDFWLYPNPSKKRGDRQ